MKKQALVPMVVAFGVCLVVAGSANAVPQTKDQQKCITKINKNGWKVADKQGKENAKCVKFAGKGKLDKLGAATAQGCLTTDVKGKIQKKKDKTIEFEAKFCTEPEDIPDFGVPSSAVAATVNAAAQDNEIALVADIFGPDLDAALADCDTDKDACKCQQKISKDAEKLASKQFKEFIKCKKFALKDNKEPFLGGAASAADLEACVDDAGTPGSIAADTKGKILKKADKVAKDASKKCANAKNGPVSIAANFPGVCSGGDASGGETLATNDFAQCVNAVVSCRVCLTINAVDDLNVDCSAFSGIQCPPASTTHKCTLETSTCDGGSNTCTLSGNPCTQDADCAAEASNLSIATQLFTAPPVPLGGAVDVDCGDGTLDGSGKAGCECTIQSFDPIALAGIGTVCIDPGTNSCPTGEIDCNGGNNLSWDTQSDHNIGACTSNADCAAQCATACGADIVTDSGCENFCEGGANDGLACTQDTDCPDGACNGPDGGAHGNVCGCQCLSQVGPASGAGDVACQLPTKIKVVLPAGAPCTNPPSIDLPPVCIPLTTDNASGTILSANNGAGSFGNSGGGVPFACNDLFNSVTSGAEVVGVVNFFDSTLGDLSVLTTAVCQ